VSLVAVYSRSTFLCRDKGRIFFASLSGDMQATYAVSLCKFLVRHGTQCGVEVDVTGACNVQLRGLPDLDLVERLIGIWMDTINATPPEPQSIW
jgi:hypothetical protein